MKILTKCRYALQMLLDLAQHQGDGYIALRDIAVRQDISRKYLEQILPVFNHARVLPAQRGAGGGYRLSKDPSCYTVGDILRMTENSLAPVTCLDDDANKCRRSSFCLTLLVWEGLNKVICEYLDSVTLQVILDSRPENSGPDYMI